MTLPPIGATGLVRTGGWQARAIRSATRSKWNHAVTYVGNGWLVEAQPGGAQKSSARNYPADIEWVLSDCRDPAWDGEEIARQACNLVGTPYNWADIASVGLLQYHIKPYLLRAYVQRQDSLICSQLCDLAAMRAGYHWFDDGRWPGDVTPGDIGRRAGL